MSKMDKFVNSLMEPAREFSAIPFWFLNDDLSKEELSRQLRDFAEKGVYGVVLHPRIGIPKSLRFLSDEYFDLIRHCVQTCQDLEMQVVLYDEAMYPSGSAWGGVVRANPDFAPYGITLSSDGKDGRIIAEKDGRFIVEKRSPGTIRGIHFGEDDGEPDAPKAADLLNPESVSKYIELVHDAHYLHLKEFFGNTIIGFFTDEPDPLGRNARGYHPWQGGMDAEITARGGDLTELFGLFDNQANPTIDTYKSMIVEKLNNIYYKRLFDWCESHGIALMGHPAGSDDMDEMKYFHVPGQDVVFRWMGPERPLTGVHSAQGKCSSDGARHLGRRRNSNEFLGVCGRENERWHLTAWDVRWFINWLGVRGVNQYIPHAFYYSVAGKRKDERPPDVGPNNIWWPHYRIIADYIRRISHLMTDAPNTAKIAVLCESGNMAQDEMRHFYEYQIEFNYLARSFLVDFPETDGKICIQGYTYEHILDAKSPRIEQDVLELIARTRRDIQTREPQPDLRATHIIKDGFDCYFFVNEGFEVIDTEITVAAQGAAIGVDFWGSRAFRLADGPKFDLHLKSGESLLVVMDAAGDSTAATAPKTTDLGDLTEQFSWSDESPDDISKTYTALLDLGEIAGNEIFTIRGEEMAECYVNGHFAGVSLTNSHTFNIGKFLTNGVNSLRVVFTGSAANRYGNISIPYGIL